MKASTIIGLFIAVTTASAIPVQPRHDNVEIVFIGAADAQFTQSFPSDGSVVSISMLPFLGSNRLNCMEQL